MTPAEHKAEFDRYGLTVVRGFLPPDALMELMAQLDRYVRDVVPSLPETSVFYLDRSRPETLKQLHHMDVDPYFARIAGTSPWKSLAATLIGEDVRADAPEWFNKPPGSESPTPAHQDNYYFSLVPPNVVTIWLALDVVDEENGCLRYVRGSHRQGVRPHGRSNILGFSQGISDFGPSDQKQEVAVHLQPGDAVAHHGNTIHRAEPNRSATRNRRAFAIVYKGVSCQRDEEAFARYKAALAAQHEQMGLIK